MASRSRSSGGGTANKIVWFLVVAGLIFAFFQIPYDPGVKGIIGIAESKSKTVQNWAENIGPNISGFVEDIIRGGSEMVTPDVPEGGPLYDQNGTGTESTPEDVANSLGSLTIADRQDVAYDREEWNHWVDVRSCWTVREAVLVRDAVEGSLSLKDAQGNATTDVNAACEVVSGKWVDPYSGKEITNPKDLDIDHMIPLKYAAQHGGNGWDKDRKQQYANSLDYNGHLLAVSAGENRSKSDRGPGDWKPKNKGHHCQYATNWVTISQNWGLSVSAKDAEALKEMLATCA